VSRLPARTLAQLRQSLADQPGALD
jgi:hypothetical protein